MIHRYRYNQTQAKTRETYPQNHIKSIQVTPTFLSFLYKKALNSVKHLTIDLFYPYHPKKEQDQLFFIRIKEQDHLVVPFIHTLTHTHTKRWRFNPTPHAPNYTTPSFSYLLFHQFLNLDTKTHTDTVKRTSHCTQKLQTLRRREKNLVREKSCERKSTHTKKRCKKVVEVS